MFSFNKNIPDAPNNPSNDQPIMKSNNVANQGIWAVDHVGFNANFGGTHLQTTFSSKNVPGAQTDPISVLYTNSGTASTVAEMYYRNQNATFPVTSLKAFANFTYTVAGSTISINNQFNISTITEAGVNPYVFTITLNSNVTTTNNVCVLIDAQTNLPTILSPTYSFAANVLTIQTNLIGAVASVKFNFIILQA